MSLPVQGLESGSTDYGKFTDELCSLVSSVRFSVVLVNDPEGVLAGLQDHPPSGSGQTLAI